MGGGEGGDSSPRLLSDFGSLWVVTKVCRVTRRTVAPASPYREWPYRRRRRSAWVAGLGASFRIPAILESRGSQLDVNRSYGMAVMKRQRVFMKER